uniref:Uncharacterized protein n=1 Tax=Romanomermis culicivorax TaxID=13658 RepID=A0A915JVG2_ROMCU
DWANYEEFRDDKTPKAKSKIFESEAKKRKSKEEKVVSASTNSVIIADDEHVIFF